MRAAARAYNVPRTTIADKLSGRVPEAATPTGRRPMLTPEEESTLVRYTQLMAEIGYPLTKMEFLKEVKRILDIDGRETVFKNNLPGYKWFELFKKRNPDMAMRTPMSLGHERSKVSQEMVEGWFNGLFRFLEKEVPDFEKVIKNPRRIFNGDESGFPLYAKQNRVLAPKGARNVYQVVTNNKVQITVMAAFNAFGEYVPPLILFPGERLRDVGLSGFPEASYATTKNGWMDTETFVAYLGTLVNFAMENDIQFPILFFVDGHSTHVSLPAAEFCRKNRVILYCLLPNATHVLQACDIGLFGPMKKAWQQTVKNWQVKNLGVALSKKEFPGLLKETWRKTATFENAAHGFRKAGLFPLSPEGVDLTKLAPSKVEKARQIAGAEKEGEAAVSLSSATKLPSSEASEENTNTAETPSEQAVPSVPESATQSTSALPCDNTNTVVIPSDTTRSTTSTVQASPSTTPTVTVLASPSTTSTVIVQASPSTTSTVTVQASPSIFKSSCETQPNVAPAFLQLAVPEVKPKKVIKRLSDKLPKAISGTKAIEMLREKENKKKEEEEAKKKRKEERIEKKMQREAEKERKRKEREEKKQAKEESKAKKSGKRPQKKRKLNESDTDSEGYNSSALIDDGSDNEYEELELCPGCNKGDQPPSRWAICNECGARWHFLCANYMEMELLDEEERKKFEFTCPLCQ